MPPLARSKFFDLIVLGATGHTGRLCAEYIASNLPTNLSWAVAGRSKSKLLAIIEDLKALNSDRLQPGAEIVSLTSGDLHALTSKTRLLINTVGPYHLYSTPVVEACAKSGTYYLDVTGESPWVLEMIDRYHEIAKTNHAILIPQIGIESAPSDLLAFALANLIRKELSVGTKEVIASVHELSGTPSGGTLATVLSLLDHYGLNEVAKSSGSWASSPVPRPQSHASPSLMSKVFGTRSVPGLGTLTTSVAAGPNVSTVQRSWGLLDSGKLYGDKFQYREYMRVRNSIVGAAFHLALFFTALALSLPPIRWLAKKILYAPGQGPTKQAASTENIEYRAIATADQAISHPSRAFARLRWDGSLYRFTGVCLAEAAMVLLNDADLTRRLDGGLLTPAVLGQPFIDRLKNAGMVFEVEMMPRDG